MYKLLEIYPFNLARDILGSNEEALKIYIPGMESAMETLGEREQNIIRRRYKNRMTLKDIGKIHNIGGERVRQLETMAIRKLRHAVRRSMIMGVPKIELDRASDQYYKLLNKYESILAGAETYNKEINKGKIHEVMNTSITDLGLSTRSRRGLMRAGKRTLGDIVEMKERELEYTRNLGTKSINEIKEKLKEYGLSMQP